MTFLAGRFPAVVMTASPVGQPPCLFLITMHSSKIAGPPARWMAPSTPPPPSNELLAAFTIASTCSLVMSPCLSVTVVIENRKFACPNSSSAFHFCYLLLKPCYYSKQRLHPVSNFILV